jgi:hypothetical protein
MSDIHSIPTEELEKDLLDSNIDIGVCETALQLGITSYSGGPIQKRLEANKCFVKVITAELERRKAAPAGERDAR